eukprot:gene22215-28329_t
MLSESVSESRTVKVEWFETEQGSVAYAHFSVKSTAMKAAKICNGKNIHGENFTTVIKYSVRELFEGEFRSLFKGMHLTGCSSIDIKHGHALKSLSDKVRRLLEQHGGRVESFEPQAVAAVTSNKRRAVVGFTEASSTVKALAALHGQEQALLNGSPLYLTPFFACKFSVLRGLWTVVEAELMSLKAAVAADIAQNRVKFVDFQSELVVTLRLTSSDARQLATVKILIEDILRGEVLFSNAGKRIAPLWHDTFSGPSGVQVVKSFSSPEVFVLRDENRRQLRVYGKSSDIQTCRGVVEAYLEQCKQLVHRVSISAGAMNVLLKAGRLDALQAHCGARNKPSVDFISMCVEVVGDAVVEQRAKSYLLNLASEAAQTVSVKLLSDDSQEVCCPVCMCPVEEGDTKTLECGHSYCVGCFAQYLAQSLNSYDAKFPICCLSGKCLQPVSLFELEASLSIADAASMYSAALKNYVKRNPQCSNFCITPDCEQIYCWESGVELVAQCSSCFMSICVACKVESHDGLTCAQYEAQRHGDKEYAEWRKKHDVKACPKCGCDIEKSDGCNHMTCAQCHTHICWVCMATFKEGKATYDHMSQRHGGFYQR